MRGLRPFNRYVESWWRRAAYSSCSDNRDRIVEVTNENRKKRTRAMGMSVPNGAGNSNRISWHGFSGPTGAKQMGIRSPLTPENTPTKTGRN